jgi:uroporphyrinogen III methyltransferase/synthase
VELVGHVNLSGKRCLLLRADAARPALPKLLREAGADVTDLAAYHTKRVAGLPENVLAALRKGEVDWATFTSSSTAKNLVEMLGDERSLLEGVRIASIGPITSETIRGLGLAVAVEARRSDVEGLVEALCRS